MFEKIVEKILSPILSEYVEDFNAENMKIGLWSGEVVIKNVALRKEIIKKLNLPFRLKYSRLGTLRMTIPWKSLGSSRIDIVIEGLELLISELPQNEWECKNHKIIEQRKQEVLSFCESIVNDFAKKTEKASKEEEEQGYFGAMVTRIIDNVQVTVKDIHVRYEDEISKKYSFGVTLEELKIFTVNKKGEPEFIDRTKKENEKEPLRKKLLLSNFGVYWNEASQFFDEVNPHQSMYETISRANQKTNDMNYLILMSSQAELYQREPGKQYIEPEINLIINFDELKIKISNEQLQQIITLSERLQSYMNEVRAQNRKKLTHEEMLNNYKEYIRIFPSFFEKKITPKDQNIMDSILEKMEVENFKEGMKTYIQEKQKEKMVQDKLSKNKGWFSFSNPKELSETEMKEIENFMKDNFGSEISIIKRPEDFFYIKVNFNLKLLNISVATTSSTKKIEEGISLNLIQIGMEFNLREGGYRLDFGMENILINLYNKQLDQPEFTKVTNILQKMPQEGCSRKIEQYVKLRVVGNPLDKKHLDTEIILKTEEILLEFDPNLVKIATNFAKIKISEKNTEAAFEAYGDMKNKVANAANEAAENLAKTEKKKNFISLDVKLSSINILLYFDPLNIESDVWVINLGETEIFSDAETLSKPEFTEDEAMEKYSMKTSKMCMIHYENKTNFLKAKSEQLSIDIKEKVLSELSVDFEVEMFKTATEKIPKLRTKCIIHTLDLNLSQNTYPALQKIGNCFLLPPHIEAEAKKESKQQKANEKSEVMKGSKKIGIIYEQTKEPIKYIGVLSGSYLYLYLDKKDAQYKTYFYVKHSKFTIVPETEPTKKPLSLVVENSVQKFTLGFDKQSVLDEWVAIIKKLDEEEINFLLAESIGKASEVEEAPKKAVVVDQNTLNLELYAVLEKTSITAILNDNQKVLIEIKQLTTNAKLHESKTLAKIHLKSIEITDNIYNYKNVEFNKFLYSSAIEGKEKLIEINFEQITEKHSDYALIDANISVDVGRLVCNYKTETVANLMLFFIPLPEPELNNRSSLQSRASIESRNSLDSEETFEILSVEETKKKKIEKVKNEIAQGVPEKYAVKLKLNIEEIAVSLINRKAKTMIAKVGLNGLKVDFGQSNRKMTIGGSIKELWLADYSNYPTTIIEEQEEYTFFHYIVESEGKTREMITYDIQILEVPNEIGKTMLIKSSLYDLKVSYVQQPVLRLIAYLTEQLLPSLTPDSSDFAKPKPIVVIDSKPEDSPMDIVIELENILTIIQPRTKEQELLELLVKNILVKNNVFQRPFIKNAENETEKVLVENYLINVDGVSIIAKYKGKESKLTNDLSITLSCDLIQNPAYYRKIFNERFDAGMRVSCKLSPFLMRINHDDYNFLMKCLNYNVTFDDNAEGYLYDGLLQQEQIKYEKEQNQSTKLEPITEPIFMDVSMDRIILCITEKELPLSVLLLSQLELYLNMGDFGMKMQFIMKNLYGTNISQTTEENLSIEKGMFNLFGFERKLNTSDLYEMPKLIQIYSVESIQQFLNDTIEKPVINLNFIQTKASDIIIEMAIQGLRIGIELKSLLTLSQLAITSPDIQPIKSSIKPILIKSKQNAPPPTAGKTLVSLRMTDFLGCLSDKSGKNYVVMEGEFEVRLDLVAPKPEDQVIALGKSKDMEGDFDIVGTHIISIKNFSFYFCNVNNLKNKRFILNPIHLNLHYDQFYAIKEGIVFLKSSIHGKLEKIIVECSVRDMLLLSNIGLYNLEVMNEYNKNMEEIKKQEIEAERSEVSLIQAHDLVVDEKVIEKTKEKIKKKIQNKIEAEVEVDPMQIRVVNDCNNNFMPVINFITQEVKVFFTGNAIKNHFTTSLAMKLDFFNPRSANWEPIIETFQLNIDFLSLVSEFGPKNKIIITNTEIDEMKELKINLSTQLVTTLLATIEVAKKEQKQIEKIQNLDEIEVSPYIIENKTNEIILVDRLNKPVEILPLFKGPIKLNDKAEQLNFIYKNKKYSVNLEKFGIIGIPQLNDIHLDFRMEKLNRVICFVGNWTIKNETSKPLYCFRFDKNKKPLEENLLIQPGESVPIHIDGFAKLSRGENDSTSLKNFAQLKETNEWDSENGRYRLMVQEVRAILGHSSFIIRSPLVIMNCLPKILEIKFIVDGQEVLKESKKIPSQGVHEGFTNKNIENIQYKIKCEGYEWSNLFGADSTRFGREERLFMNDGENGTTINFIIEKDYLKKQYRLNIFCSAFIVSELDFDIEIYTNSERDEVNQSIEKYQKLGGQNEMIGLDNQKRPIDKITLVDANSGSKIRVCGKNCIPDFSEPTTVKNLGVNQTRIVIEKEVNGKLVTLFTVLGVEVELKKMSLRADVVSRQITLRSRWIFFNNSEHNLSIKELGGDKFYYNINKNEKKPFYFIIPELKEKPKGLIFKTDDTEESIPLQANGLGAIYFRLQKFNVFEYSQYLFFKLNVQEIESYIYYDITEVSYENLPYQIILKSDKLEAYVPIFNKYLTPTEGQKQLQFINELPHQPLNIDLQIRLKGTVINHIEDITVEADNLNFKVTRKMFEEGVTEMYIQAVVYVIFNDSRKYIVIDEFHKKEEETPEYEIQDINFKLEKLSLSIIQNSSSSTTKPKESFYFYMENLEFVMAQTNKTTKYQTKLQFLQFDQDEPYNIPNPVIITPSKYKQFTSRDPKDKPKFIFNSLIEIDNSFVKNMFFNQIIIDVNDIVVRVETAFIKLILQIVKEYTDAAKTESEYLIQRKTNTWELINPPSEGAKTFIKSITIAPFTVEISALIRLNELDAESVIFFGTFLNAVGVVITNIEDAPISLEGIMLKDCVDTMQGINNKLIEHYKGSVIRQLYKIFGSLNIIGNPVSLFKNISTGFKDLKEKPSEGFVEGPLEFGKGLAEGTGSLIAHSVGGALNSVEKVTGSVASGLAALTFDKEFEQMREREKMKKPKHVFDGLESGGKAVFHGFKEGISGLFLKPIESTKKEGALGFFKGTAQGFAGLVTKPLTGVIDFASKTTEGLKNTALYLEDKPNENRIRYPRVLYTETGMVREYDEVDSRLQATMNKEVNENKEQNYYFIESYKTGSKAFVVVTNIGLVSIDIGDEKILWNLNFSEVKYERTQDNVVFIKGSPKNKGFFDKDISQSIQFINKSEADRFMKLIDNLKASACIF